MKPQYNSNRVCCIINGLGDLVTASVAFRYFKQLFPNIDLFLVTWPGIFAESQKYNPYLKAIFPVGGQPNDQYIWAQKNGFDTSEIVVLDNIISFARFCPKCNEGSIDWWWRTLKVFNLHLCEGYSLQLCGDIPENCKPEFFVGEEDYKYARELEDFSPYIVVNHTTGSNRSNKEWPLVNWYSLLQMTLDNFPQFHIITVGGPNDAIIPLSKNCVKNIRDTRIREIYPLLLGAKFHLLSQSGIAHMAACTDVRGLQINVGSPKEISGNIFSNTRIVDQLKLFSPESVSLEMVWNPLKEELDGINV